MTPSILINGKKQNQLSVFNRLVQFGDGLFETCLLIEGKLILANQHFERLEKGSKRLKIANISRSIWLEDIVKAVSLSRLNNGVVKIILSRGESVRGYGFAKNITPTRIIIVDKLPDLTQDYVLSVCKSGYANNALLSEIKHCNRLEQVLARADLNALECVMLDAQNHVISVTQGNIFAIKNGALLTPNLDNCGIKGTRRQVIIQLAKKLGLAVKIGPLSLEDFLKSDEVFISNSLIGIRPVRQINAQIYLQRTHTTALKIALDKYILKRKNSIDLSPKKSFFKWILLAVAGLSTAWIFWANTINAEKSTVFQVPYGANIHLIANNLKHFGLVNSSQFVILAAKLSGLGGQLKSGYYDVQPNTSVLDLLSDFAHAKVATRRITLVEGKTVREYYQLLSNHQALTTQFSLAEILDKTGVKMPYDGNFWPDTYHIHYGDSVLSVFNRAHRMLQKKLAEVWQNRAKNHFLKSPSQLLILASLIEKETAHNPEKAKISGVFINRLQKNMRLQTDPTIAYALGEAYTGRLSRQDLRFKSPYNTYRNKGLPPGAIGSVGLDSLNAAAHPLPSDYLYFVAKTDATHAFAKTYKQHRININNYLK
jgi:aminodeoxychorismate lyase